MDGFEPLEGGCTCGKVRYRLTDTPICVNACHCRLCQRTSGSAFALNAMIENDRIEMIGESPPDRVEGPSDLVASVPTWRCPSCEIRLFGGHPYMKDHIRFVFVGTLDRGEALVPDAHFFVRSKHPWITMPRGVPAFETLPKDGPPPTGAEARNRMLAAIRG